MIYLDDLLILFCRNGFVPGRVALVRDTLHNFGLSLWVDLAERKFDVPERKRHQARAAVTEIA